LSDSLTYHYTGTVTYIIVAGSYYA